MGVFITSFAGTTLDTATRIQRYIIAELVFDSKKDLLANRWIATGIAVITALILTFATEAHGKRLFGTFLHIEILIKIPILIKPAILF